MSAEALEHRRLAALPGISERRRRYHLAQAERLEREAARPEQLELLDPEPPNERSAPDA